MSINYQNKFKSPLLNRFVWRKNFSKCKLETWKKNRRRSLIKRRSNENEMVKKRVRFYQGGVKDNEKKA